MAIKEVRFDIWCEKCEFKDLPETEDPCDHCLEDAWNEDSTKPTLFKEKSE